MPNYNIFITSPKGDRRYEFHENKTMDECKKWVDTYGPAPIGWKYQVVNRNKTPRRRPLYTVLHSWVLNDGNLEYFDNRKVFVQLNDGSWYTPKRAKQDLRAMGATKFQREKVWEEFESPDEAWTVVGHPNGGSGTLN